MNIAEYTMSGYRTDLIDEDTELQTTYEELEKGRGYEHAVQSLIRSLGVSREEASTLVQIAYEKVL